MGSIARDSNGALVAARAGRATHVSDAFGTELRAVERAPELAAGLGVVRLVVETDAMLVDQALNRHAPDFSKEAQVIEDVKIQNRLWFFSCVFSHCKHEADKPAHCLAQLGLDLSDGEFLVLDDDVSACVAQTVS